MSVSSFLEVDTWNERDEMLDVGNGVTVNVNVTLATGKRLYELTIILIGGKWCGTLVEVMTSIRWKTRMAVYTMSIGPHCIIVAVTQFVAVM